MPTVIKIGVFDSGVGGKLIARMVEKELPKATVIFRSDPDYFPYGNKTPEVILERVSLFAKKFQQLGCAIVVIACNSATTNVIERLRQLFPRIQFVGVEPPLKPISRLTNSKKIAIMGTNATIASERRKILQELFARGITVYNIVCPGLAEYIEKRVMKDIKCGATFYNDQQAKDLIKKFLDKPIAEGVDVVGIACTHYPYLLPQMKELYPQVTFYDPADAVVKYVKRIYSPLALV